MLLLGHQDRKDPGVLLVLTQLSTLVPMQRQDGTQQILDYFDPHLDKSHGEGRIITVGKDIYYRSAILFVERIRDLATVKGWSIVRSNLSIALRGSALTWYTAV